MIKLKKNIAIVFLTFNSELTIEKSLIKASKISKNLYVVDSFSTDKTVKICKKFKCKVIKRKFTNYSSQRNWIINKLNKNFLWQLHLDADEVLDNKLINSIKKIIKNSTNKKNFLLKRKNYFLGLKINFPGINIWHLRLFRSYSAKCEKRLYDQHFISKFKVQKIFDGFMHDNDMLNIHDWKQKHRKWAEMEANEVKKINTSVSKNIFKKNDPRHYSRKTKVLYYKLPRYLRVIIYFLYRYFLRLSFLDGKSGLLFSFYHIIWFRMLIDYKINRKK